MSQKSLFTESIYQALDDVVRACDGYEKVAGQLWPKKATGYNSLKNKLNPNHHEKFDAEEIIALIQMGRDRGVHTAMYFLADAGGYKRPEEAAPRARTLEIRAKQAEHMAEVARLEEEYERAAQKEALEPIRERRAEAMRGASQ